MIAISSENALKANSSTSSGTQMKFDAPVANDTVIKAQQNIQTKHQCITAMKNYETRSLEELRVEDYLANRKGRFVSFSFGAPPAGGASLFGTAAAKPSLFGASTGSAFSTATTSAGGGLFGSPTAVATGGGLFGGQPQATKSLFGAPGAFNFGQPTATYGGLFGKPAASSDDVLEALHNTVMDGGDSTHQLVSSDGQVFFASVVILKAKSAYFKRFFATDGWKEQAEGRTMLVWSSAVVIQLMRYVYLNEVDGDICKLLPDILHAAQLWELIGMKAVIEGQMKQKLQQATHDTDIAAEYLKMAHLHGLTTLVPICNGVLADNYDRFFDSDQFKQIERNDTYRHLLKDIFHRKGK